MLLASLQYFKNSKFILINLSFLVDEGNKNDLREASHSEANEASSAQISGGLSSLMASYNSEDSSDNEENTIGK